MQMPRDSQTSYSTKSKRDVVDAISQIRRISRRGVYPVSRCANVCPRSRLFLAIAAIILPMLLSKRISVFPAPFSFSASVNMRIPCRYAHPREKTDNYRIRLPHKRLIYCCVWIRDRRAIGNTVAETDIRQIHVPTEKTILHEGRKRERIYIDRFRAYRQILIDFNWQHAVHNSLHTLAPTRIKVRWRIFTRAHSSRLEFIAIPMAALQFKFHPSRFVTDRHRVPNSSERNLTNGIKYVNDRSPVNDHCAYKYILILHKVTWVYFFTKKHDIGFNV